MFQFVLTGLWVSDITYIETCEGYLYLPLITDAYSRKIIGWNISPKLEAEGGSKCSVNGYSTVTYRTINLIHHSDRGTQYCCDNYVSKLNILRITISMTENGDPLENAIAERVNGILKSEWLYRKLPDTKLKTASVLPAIIDAYNNRKPHLSINMMTLEDAHYCQGIIPKKWKNYWKERAKET